MFWYWASHSTIVILSIICLKVSLQYFYYSRYGKLGPDLCDNTSSFQDESKDCPTFSSSDWKSFQENHSKMNWNNHFLLQLRMWKFSHSLLNVRFICHILPHNYSQNNEKSGQTALIDVFLLKKRKSSFINLKHSLNVCLMKSRRKCTAR